MTTYYNTQTGKPYVGERRALSNDPEIPGRPGANYQYDPQAGRWMPDLSRIRARRNALLAASDWTDLPHAPLTDERKKAWQSYRQALRDLPAKCDIDSVKWPEPPVN